MPTITADLGSNSVAVAALAGAISTNVPLLLLGTDSGLVGPLDQGTGVTCTITQGANTVVLTMADGTGSRLNANGVNLDLFAQVGLPLPGGLVQGAPAETITWTGSVGGVAFAFSQAGTIGPGGPSNLPDLDWQSGFPVVDLGIGTSLLGLGTKEWVHVPLSASDAASGLPFDLSGTTVTMALYNWLTADDPMPGDFQACDMLIRTAAPFGTFARARFDTAALGLPRASYRVRVKITLGPDTVVLTAPGAIQIW